MSHAVDVDRELLHVNVRDTVFSFIQIKIY